MRFEDATAYSFTYRLDSGLMAQVSVQQQSGLGMATVRMTLR